MKKSIVFLSILFALAIRANAQQPTTPDVPRTISYQAALTDKDGNPIKDDTYQITARLYADALGQQPIWWGTYRVQAERGVINLQLGAGAFPLPNTDKMSTPLWLGIQLNSNGELDYYAPLSASPYALTVPNGAITANKLAPGAVTPDKVNMDYVSSITVNGQQVTGKGTSLNIATGNGLDATVDPGTNTLMLSAGGNSSTHSGKGDVAQSHVGGPVDYWGEIGNKSTTAGPNFVGTTDNVALEIHVNDSSTLANSGYGRVMRYEPHTVSPNLIGGSKYNTLTNSPQGVVIAGGGTASEVNSVDSDFGTIGGGTGNQAWRYGTVAGGEHNTVKTDYGTVGGGLWNTAGDAYDDSFATVGGGRWNEAREEYSTIAGGDSNKTLSPYTTVGGGYANYIEEAGTWASWYSTIAGGTHNRIYDQHGFIGGGDTNVLYHNADYGVISGGQGNLISTSSDVDNNNLAYSSILGGELNTIVGKSTSVLGGRRLKLKDYSVGFNGDTINKTVDLSAFNHTAYFGDVNLWIGNIDNTARQLRFYEPNTDTAYVGTNFSSFQAGGQLGNIIYTLPTAVPVAGQFLKAATVTGSTNVGLSWDTVTGSGGGGGGTAGWLLTGNSTTSPPTNYLGTIDSAAFEIHVHNNAPDTTRGVRRVMRYAEGETSPNILGGSNYNTIADSLSGSVIAGGGSLSLPNAIKKDSSYHKKFPANFSTISGGEGNITWGEHDVIAGGRGNIMMVDTFRSGFNAIGGGDSNFVGWGSYDNTISGGAFNLVANAYGTIGGGFHNLLNGAAGFNTIAGGHYNTVGGDILVNALSQYSTIGGGDSNMIREQASSSTIAGGYHNTIDSAMDYSTIGGGKSNKILRQSAFWASLYGHEGSCIGGGENNSIYSNTATIAGGINNTIAAASDGSAITGGYGNSVRSSSAFVGGGSGNIVDTASFWSTISGGQSNKIRRTESTIGGGKYNFIDSQALWLCDNFGASVIAGGNQDTITSLNKRWRNTDSIPAPQPNEATIAGGSDNSVNGDYGSVGGGHANHALGLASSIPGGIGLEALDYQTVVGRYNSNVPYNSGLHDTDGFFGIGARLGDMPVFIVGNGLGDYYGTTVRSNALEVSDRGAITLHDTLGDTRAMRAGSAYVDNQIYAWAVVDSNGHIAKDTGVSPQKEQAFGVQPITGYHLAHNGGYEFLLTTLDNNSGLVQFRSASIVVTIVPLDDNGGCVIPTTSLIGTDGTFYVRLKDPAHSCMPTNERFTFHVVARPK